jgi:type IV pilus assembly protein PilX
MNRIFRSCTTRSTSVAGRNHQGGAVLLVGLIMLTVAAIIVVSGMRSVVMEKNMASNSQYEMLVFQAAETAIEGMLTDDTAIVEAVNTPTSGTPTSRTFSVDHADAHFAITSDATITVGTPTIPIGGYSIEDFRSYPFTIVSSGEIASINASATHTQTASKIAPFLRSP